MIHAPIWPITDHIALLITCLNIICLLHLPSTCLVFWSNTQLHCQAHFLTGAYSHRPSCYYDVEEAFRRDSCKSLTAMPVVGSKGEALGAVSLGLQHHVNLSTK